MQVFSPNACSLCLRDTLNAPYIRFPKRSATSIRPPAALHLAKGELSSARQRDFHLSAGAPAENVP